MPGLHMLWKRCGNHLVGVWLERLTFHKNKNHKKFFPGGSGGISMKFCTREISRYTVYGTTAPVCVAMAMNAIDAISQYLCMFCL